MELQSVHKVVGVEYIVADSLFKELLGQSPFSLIPRPKPNPKAKINGGMFTKGREVSLCFDPEEIASTR